MFVNFTDKLTVHWVSRLGDAPATAHYFMHCTAIRYLHLKCFADTTYVRLQFVTQVEKPTDRYEIVDIFVNPPPE